jgi:hypothetical protein
MARTLVPVIEPPGISAVEPVHSAGEIGLGGLDDEVIVICHQYPGGDAPTETLYGLAEEGEKHRAINVVAEDGPLFIAAGSDVIKSAGKLDAKRSCHSTPRFPRLPRLSEESPPGRRISVRSPPEWKIGKRGLHEEWAMRRERKSEGVTPMAKLRRERKERRCDPRTRGRERTEGHTMSRQCDDNTRNEVVTLV